MNDAGRRVLTGTQIKSPEYFPGKTRFIMVLPGFIMLDFCPSDEMTMPTNKIPGAILS